MINSFRRQKHEVQMMDRLTIPSFDAHNKLMKNQIDGGKKCVPFSGNKQVCLNFIINCVQIIDGNRYFRC